VSFEAFSGHKTMMYTLKYDLYCKQLDTTSRFGSSFYFTNIVESLVDSNHFWGVISRDVVDAHVLPHVGKFRSHQKSFRTAGQLDEISHDRLKFEVAIAEMETIPNESVTYTQ